MTPDNVIMTSLFYAHLGIRIDVHVKFQVDALNRLEEKSQKFLDGKREKAKAKNLKPVQKWSPVRLLCLPVARSVKRSCIAVSRILSVPDSYQSVDRLNQKARLTNRPYAYDVTSGGSACSSEI